MPENNWILNDTIPSSLAQEFQPAAAGWSGVVWWSLFEQAITAATNVTVVITGLALGAIALSDEAVTGDSNAAIAGLALGGVALGNATERGDAVTLITGFSSPVALADEAVYGDANARPSGVAVGDLTLGAVAVIGDANTVLNGFDVPVALGDETARIDATATPSGVEIGALSLGSYEVTGDAVASVAGVSTGALAVGWETEEVVVPQPPALYAGKRVFGGSEVDYVRNARAGVRGLFVGPLELGTVKAHVDRARDTVASVVGIATGSIRVGQARAIAEDNLTDEELLLVAMAA